MMNLGVAARLQQACTVCCAASLPEVMRVAAPAWEAHSLTPPPPCLPACSQIGLAEMKEAVQLSGGMVVQTDTFTNVVFKESLKRVFAKDGEDGFLGTSSNATFEVRGQDVGA